MPIACPQCQAQNADGARFCRVCGTSLAVAAAAPVEAAAADGVSCDDCGHLNAAGTRYCAKCGYSLVGTVIVSRRDSTFGAFTPAHTPPSAPAPAHARVNEDSDTFDALSAPTQSMSMGGDTQGPFSRMAATPATGAAASPAPSRTGLWITLGVVAVLVLGGGWWLMKPASKPVDVAATAPAAAPAAVEPAPAPAVAAPLAAPPPEPVAAAAPPQAPPAATTQPPAAVPDPQQEAALKAAREKAARDRAERDARATAALAQREQELARQRAEQEAARARAAAQQQARTTAAVPVAPVATPTVQGVKEMCGGRNPISQGLCEARECRKAEHASEVICKQLKEAEERRLYQ